MLALSGPCPRPRFGVDLLGMALAAQASSLGLWDWD